MSETPNSRPDADPAATRGERGPSAELTTDELFHTLQSERRRLALRYLLEREPPTDVETLAEAVATAERDTTHTALSDETRERVSLDLCQSHLPKLDRFDLIDYDRERGTVAPTPAIDLFEPYLADPLALDAVDAEDDATTAGPRDWTGYYAGASLASVGLVGVAALGPLSPVALSFGVVAGLVTVMHAAVTTGLVLSTEH
jgi:hypothetical protein